MSEKRKGKYYGGTPWNKGLTKKDDSRIASGDQVRHAGQNNGMYGKTHTDKVKQELREKNVLTEKWKGEDNPWYGKSRSGQNSPRFLSEKDRSEWEYYRDKVRSLTEITYKNNKDIINPNGYKRGIIDYHLDHIIPLWHGFKNNIDPTLLSLPENLRMLLWSTNIKRHKTKLNNDERIFLRNLIEQYNKGY